MSKAAIASVLSMAQLGAGGRDYGGRAARGLVFISASSRRSTDTQAHLSNVHRALEMLHRTGAGALGDLTGGRTCVSRHPFERANVTFPSSRVTWAEKENPSPAALVLLIPIPNAH